MSRDYDADAVASSFFAEAARSAEELRQIYPLNLDIDAILGPLTAATLKTADMAHDIVIYDEASTIDHAAFAAALERFDATRAHVVVIQGPTHAASDFDRWLGPPMPFIHEPREPQTTRWADNPLNNRPSWQKRKKGR